jgi:hypothetical protein
MVVNVQKPHEMSAPIDTHARKLRAELLGAMVRAAFAARSNALPASQNREGRGSTPPPVGGANISSLTSLADGHFPGLPAGAQTFPSYSPHRTGAQ